MLDPHLFRNDLDKTAEALARRGFELDVKAIAKLEKKRKKLQIETQDLQNERKTKSKAIGQAKAKGEDIKPHLDAVADVGEKLKKAEEGLNLVQEELWEISVGIPNIPHESVPEGKDEEDNREERVWGEIPEFDFEPKDHVDIGTAMEEGLDFETAARITGSRFTVMSGAMARLHRALIQFMLDTHTSEHGYTEPMFRISSMRKASMALASCPSLKKICLPWVREQDIS